MAQAQSSQKAARAMTSVTAQLVRSRGKEAAGRRSGWGVGGSGGQ